MKIKSEILLADLVDRTQMVLKQPEDFQRRSMEELNCRPNAKSWSALECFEHLNRYGDFYLPEIEQRIKESKLLPEEYFRSGILGNYFAKSMLPREKLNKMNTFKDKNPIGSTLTMDSLEKSIHQQRLILQLLQEAKKVNLTRVKTGTSISNAVKLRLGDTFRVIIYHNQRHMVQALRASSKEQEVLAN